MDRYLVTPGTDRICGGYGLKLPGYRTLVLTVAAFILIGLLVVAACETTRAQFQRRLAAPDLRPARSVDRGDL